MRKPIFALLLTLVLFATFTTGVSAHTVASMHTARPQANTGGCGNTVTSKRRDIMGYSCIDLNGSTLDGNAYITFQPLSPEGVVDGCYVQILFIGQHGQLPQPSFIQYNCTTQARDREIGAKFGTLQNDKWSHPDTIRAVVNVKITYSAGAVSVANNLISKPIDV